MYLSQPNDFIQFLFTYFKGIIHYFSNHYSSIKSLNISELNQEVNTFILFLKSSSLSTDSFYQQFFLLMNQFIYQLYHSDTIQQELLFIRFLSTFLFFSLLKEQHCYDHCIAFLYTICLTSPTFPYPEYTAFFLLFPHYTQSENPLLLTIYTISVQYQSIHEEIPFYSDYIQFLSTIQHQDPSKLISFDVISNLYKEFINSYSHLQSKLSYYHNIKASLILFFLYKNNNVFLQFLKDFILPKLTELKSNQIESNFIIHELFHFICIFSLCILFYSNINKCRSSWKE